MLVSWGGKLSSKVPLIQIIYLPIEPYPLLSFGSLSPLHQPNAACIFFKFAPRCRFACPTTDICTDVIGHTSPYISLQILIPSLPRPQTLIHATFLLPLTCQGTPRLLITTRPIIMMTSIISTAEPSEKENLFMLYSFGYLIYSSFDNVTLYSIRKQLLNPAALPILIQQQFGLDKPFVELCEPCSLFF